MRNENLSLGELVGNADPIDRPLLALFLWERGIQFRPAGEAIGKSHEYVRRLCLPFSDEKRITPDPPTAERIRVWTGGVVPPASFNPPEGGDRT